MRAKNLVALGCRDAADCRIKLLSGAGLNHGSEGGRDDESRASTEKEANISTGKRPSQAEAIRGSRWPFCDLSATRWMPGGT
jgi:hypothetical protein